MIHPPNASSGLISGYDLKHSFGSNAHFEWVSQPFPYWQRRFEILQKLKDAGIFHLRISTWAGYNDAPDAHWVTNPAYYDWHGFLEKAARDYGMRFTFLCGSPGPRSYRWLGDPAKIIEYIGKRHVPWTDALEAPNEYDLGAVNPEWIQPWQTALKEHMMRTAFVLKWTPVTAHIPYIGPSLVFNPNSSVQLAAECGGPLGYTDGKGIHPYTGNRPDTLAYIRGELQKPVAISEQKPAYATEWGPTTAPVPNGGWPVVNEEQAGWQVLRSHLTHRLGGIVRSFIYQAHNGTNGTGHEEQFGLLRYDMSEKPAYKIIKNLNGLLSNTKPAVIQRINYRFSTNAPTDLKHLLVHDSVNKWYLIVWREIPYLGAPVDITLELPDAPMTIRQRNLCTFGYGLPNTVNRLTFRLGHQPLALELAR